MATDTEPVGLFTEGAAGIAAIVLSIIALAGVSSVALAAVATIVIGVGLMVQGFNTAAENMRLPLAGGVAEFGGEVMVECLGGGAGIVLGVLALIGLGSGPLLSAALIVFGGALLLSGALATRSRLAVPAPGAAQAIAAPGSAATGSVELLLGVTAVVLGILSLTLTAAHTATLLLVGFIVVGAALLIVSATFGAALMRVFATTDRFAAE
ncbi:MAG TPA: hypothetical protein VG308_12350 [Stellaceae bacterium]|nr:hypothetical protein [Stellaceae bacterium]